jgi:hypothetical protein
MKKQFLKAYKKAMGERAHPIALTIDERREKVTMGWYLMLLQRGQGSLRAA